MSYRTLSFSMLSFVLITGMFLWLVPASEAAAATYYVATTGNDANPGTEAAPFRTMQKAANMVGPGDTVLVRAGTYGRFDI
jgi:hypothetical protein